MKFIDLAGLVFGRLRVMKRVYREDISPKKVYWGCICKCGNTVTVTTGALRSGLTRSCGCLKNENASTINFKHGGRGTEEYHAWCDMKTRCLNPNFKDYKYYGGRGIKICEKWIDSFENFINDMGLKPGHNYSLDRKDTNKDYEPENCKWSTYKEQCRNRRNNLLIDFNGKTITLAELSEKTGLDWHLLRYRIIDKSMSVEEAVTMRIGPALYNFKDKERTLSEISKITGINYRTLLYNVRKYGDKYIEQL